MSLRESQKHLPEGNTIVTSFDSIRRTHKAVGHKKVLEVTGEWLNSDKQAPSAADSIDRLNILV